MRYCSPSSERISSQTIVVNPVPLSFGVNRASTESTPSGGVLSSRIAVFMALLERNLVSSYEAPSEVQFGNI